jgi:cardiolipin synthase
MLHAKAMVVDGSTALLGSPNFDLRSMFVNFEIGLLVHSPAEVGKMKAWMDGIILASRELRPEPVSARRRLLGNVAEDISRLIAPLL